MDPHDRGSGYARAGLQPLAGMPLKTTSRAWWLMEVIIGLLLNRRPLLSIE
ncbi:MAG: hypothetical protein ACHQ6U_08300 [Thermodesulfobacteriota bacterium]